MTEHPSPLRRTALWVVPVADLGGVARHVLDVARAGGVPGHSMVYLCPPGPLADELRALGAAVLAEPFGPSAGLATSVRTLRRAVRSLRPVVVHSHLSYADIVAAIACAGSGARLVTTEHGIAADDLVYHGSPATARVMAGAHTARLRRFDTVLAVSRATADAMRDKWHPRQSVLVIPNGVDRPDTAASVASSAADTSATAHGIRVLSLSRLSPEKRLPELVDAFALVRRDHPDATLTLAGVGGLEPDLRAQVRALGLDDAVSLPGYVDAASAMAEADVLTQLSVWENCSYSLLDAVAHGLGVVASPVGGNPEILPDRCLADPMDAARVAEAIVEQATEPSARPSLDADWPTVAQMCARIAAAYEKTA